MLSMMDRLWRPDLTEAEALDLMHRGIEEVQLTRGSQSVCAGLTVGCCACLG